MTTDNDEWKFKHSDPDNAIFLIYSPNEMIATVHGLANTQRIITAVKSYTKLLAAAKDGLDVDRAILLRLNAIINPAETMKQFETLDTRYTSIRASHDRLLAAAKAVMANMPVPRGARRPEFDDLEDAIAKAENE